MSGFNKAKGWAFRLFSKLLWMHEILLLIKNLVWNNKHKI